MGYGCSLTSHDHQFEPANFMMLIGAMSNVRKGRGRSRSSSLLAVPCCQAAAHFEADCWLVAPCDDLSLTPAQSASSFLTEPTVRLPVHHAWAERLVDDDLGVG